MNRIVTALIPILIVAGLLALVFVFLPMWRQGQELPGTLKGADDLPPPRTTRIEGELSHDFGEVEINGPRDLRHTFTIRNAEDHAIDLLIEDTSCPCVAGELVKNALAPGEAVDIKVTLQVTRSGPTLQKVYLNADGALVILQVSAEVMRTSSAESEARSTSRTDEMP